MFGEPPNKKTVVQNIHVKHKKLDLPPFIRYGAILGYLAVLMEGINMMDESGLAGFVATLAVLILASVGAHAIIDTMMQKKDEESLEEAMKTLAKQVEQTINRKQ